ncbi:MAG: hypothetical protein EP343_32355 [Deltaproteobacteria bacterium]|nr:MAG: hypothetical protein EP343_32355 [Deltaproteobacteria bacterium]
MQQILFRLILVGCFWGLGFSALAQTSGMSSNVLVLPTGPGSLGGIGENVQANLNMGMMSYPIDIVLPKGRHNVQPNIRVTYNSSAGAGMMGIGWSLQTGGAIERLTVRGLPTYTNQDKFYGGTGELVKIPNSPFYRSRYEGSFVRYRWMQKDANDQQGYWVAEFPDGSKAYYGADRNGKSNDSSQVRGTQGTFRWEMVDFVDRNGNRIEYSYIKYGSQSYMDQIRWVFDAQGNALYQINFLYEDRPDPISDGKPGFDVQTTKRLKELTILSNGTRFRSYSFAFEDQTGLSRLIQVVRYGRDPKVPYPVAFTMKYSDATFSPANSKMVVMPTSLGLNFAQNNAGFLDINGDGLPDVVDTTNPKHRFHLNQLTIKSDMTQGAHDFPAASRKDNPIETNAKLSSPTVQLMDANGDGFTDLVDAVNKKMYLNKGNSQWEPGTLAVQNYPISGRDLDVRFFDYNGDKQIDIIRSDGTSTSYWINEGNGAWTRVVGGQDIGLSFSKDRLRLIDINGDGLMDVVHITTSSLRYKKYLGYGKWSGWISMTVPGIDKYPLSTQAQFADVNGDGMADMVAFLGTSLVYFVNQNGMAFRAGQQLQAFQGVDIPDSTKSTVRIADINGNGSRDIIWIDSSGKVTYLELFGKRPNLMTEISNGIGQRINIAYGSSVNFYLRDQACDPAKDKACGGPWQSKMPMAFPVVTTITTWASHSDKPTGQAFPTQDEKPIVRQVFYHDGFYDGNEKKFRGFRNVESLYLGDASVLTRRDLIVFDVGDKDPYFHGKMLQNVMTDESGKIYKETRMEWKDCGTVAGVDKGLTPPVRFICQAANESTIKEGEADSAKWKTLRSEATYDGFGNVVLSASLGEKNVKGDEKYTRSVFITPADPKSDKSLWFLRFPQSIEYCADLQKPCAKVTYYYDGPAFEGLPVGQLSQGNLSRIMALEDLQGQAEVALIRAKYDSHGNLVERKRASGVTRTFTYDSVYHNFPASESIKVGNMTLTSSAEWDYNLGAILRSKDMNGLTTTYSYDGFGRMVSMSMPGDPTGKPSLEYAYELKAPISRIITKSRSTLGGAQDRLVVQCIDGLGRKFMVMQQVANGRFLVSRQNSFNSVGLVERVWNSYENDGTCSFATKDSKTPSSQFFYDAMRRLVKRTFADGSMNTTVYKPLERHEFDENDNDPSSPFHQTPNITKMDGQMRMVEMTEGSNSKSQRTTRYIYSHLHLHHLDKIVAFVMPDGSTKRNTYNLLGYLKEIQHVDGTTTTFQYNQDGQVVERKDRRGKVVQVTFDEAGRVLTQQEKGNAATLIRYHYDTPSKDFPEATFTKGRLVQVDYPWGSLSTSFSNRGDVVEKRHTFMGVTFAKTFTYNNLSEAMSQTYPDKRTLKYQRDMGGRVVGIDGFVAGLTYNPQGAPQSQTFANQLKMEMVFDVRSRLQSRKVTGPSTYGFTLAYDKSGNILRWDEMTGQATANHSYTYDALDRLTQASLAGGKEVLTYGINSDDNLTEKTSSLSTQSLAHVGAYTYDPKKIHAVTTAGTTSLKYDAGGFVTSRGNQQMTWEYRGQLQAVTQNSQEVARFWYDHNASRVIKKEQGLYTFYPFGDFWIKNGEALVHPVLNGSVVARWSQPSILATFYDDLAPATGTQQLQPQPDGVINVADAWLYHASRNKLVEVPLKKRPMDLDLTQNMLEASLSRMLTDGKEEKLFFATDHLGSVRMVTDAQGAVVQTKSYYPYGTVKEQSSNREFLGFQATELDRSTQANYFGARYLDTRLARWLSPDPMFLQANGSADEWNRYSSVRHNPILYRDVGGFASENSSDIGVYISLGITAAVMLTTGITRAVNFNNTKGNRGGRSKTASIALMIGQFSTVLLAAGAAGATASGNAEAFQILGTSMLAISALNAVSSAYEIHRQNVRIKHHNHTRYKRKAHKLSVGFRASRLMMAGAELGLNLSGNVEASLGLMVAGNVATGLALVYSKMLLHRTQHKSNMEGKAVAFLFGPGSVLHTAGLNRRRENVRRTSEAVLKFNTRRRKNRENFAKNPFVNFVRFVARGFKRAKKK